MQVSERCLLPVETHDHQPLTQPTHAAPPGHRLHLQLPPSPSLPNSRGRSNPQPVRSSSHFHPTVHPDSRPGKREGGAAARIPARWPPPSRCLPSLPRTPSAQALAPSRRAKGSANPFSTLQLSSLFIKDYSPFPNEKIRYDASSGKTHVCFLTLV